jgi:hypothetical protein
MLKKDIGGRGGITSVRHFSNRNFIREIKRRSKKKKTMYNWNW